MSLNKLHFLLGVLVTSLSVVIYMETTEFEMLEIPTKTETIVRMVNVPFNPSDYSAQAEEIESSTILTALPSIFCSSTSSNCRSVASSSC